MFNAHLSGRISEMFGDSSITQQPFAEPKPVHSSQCLCFVPVGIFLTGQMMSHLRSCAFYESEKKSADLTGFYVFPRPLRCLLNV